LRADNSGPQGRHRCAELMGSPDPSVDDPHILFSERVGRQANRRWLVTIYDVLFYIVYRAVNNRAKFFTVPTRT
jgi:hypothetical protein